MNKNKRKFKMNKKNKNNKKNYRKNNYISKHKK